MAGVKKGKKKNGIVWWWLFLVYLVTKESADLWTCYGGVSGGVGAGQVLGSALGFNIILDWKVAVSWFILVS